MTERQIEKWMLDDKYLNEENDSYVYFILHGYDGYMDAIENPDNKNSVSYTHLRAHET